MSAAVTLLLWQAMKAIQDAANILEVFTVVGCALRQFLKHGTKEKGGIFFNLSSGSLQFLISYHGSLAAAMVNLLLDQFSLMAISL
ncbi:hypothetical protein ATANTOWER_014576 [Ataeniobius toweri]|uniref:Uncharacterized protein n=1 Tax=Ataeniobius toweri TaxID=208326 RepID=A0ABU7AYI9_9TELE|nr:hypothetical protein [Ataeniobius toweri]